MAKITDNVANALSDALMHDVSGKKWYTSKTFWVNTIAAGSMLIQMKYGFIIDSSMQALALTFVNLGLRAITKDPIIFK